ncbi:hypothetical protein RZS08_09535, partial [Arthrospira platensis SPKY1]|nr:hypothetical protein [Arthrospira platensis SPKY1]
GRGELLPCRGNPALCAQAIVDRLSRRPHRGIIVDTAPRPARQEPSCENLLSTAARPEFPGPPRQRQRHRLSSLTRRSGRSSPGATPPGRSPAGDRGWAAPRWTRVSCGR